MGQRIKFCRKELGLTQTQLAEKLCTTQDTVSLWECEKSYPDVHNIILLCGLFKVSSDYLLGIVD